MSPGRERWGGSSLSWCQPAAPPRPLVVPPGVVCTLGLPGAAAQPGRACPPRCWDTGTGTVLRGWCLGLGRVGSHQFPDQASRRARIEMPSAPDREETRSGSGVTLYQPLLC